VLGAFGLRRAGVPVPFSVWDRHLEGLCDHQAGDGSWTYDPSRAPNGYPNGTYMGIAGLLVAEEALAGRITDPARLQRIAAVKARGLKALRRDVLAFVKSTKSAATRTRGKFPRVAGPIVVDGYGMYALEKACIFAGLERVDGESWYEAGARLLVAAQNDDGNWAGDLNTTSFALLFLTRSPERYRPIVTTVTTITDSPTRPTTPSDPRPAAPPPAMAEGGR
jgi:hypothetical protein